MKGSTPVKNQKKKHQISVNGTFYTRLNCVGKGGSCRVFRVLGPDYALLALKRVNLRDTDEATVMGYKNEIDILRTLSHVHRVVRLVNWELNNDTQTLSLVCFGAE